MFVNHTAEEAGGYQITNSLRFRANASAYLSRTPVSAGNRTTWTWAGWVKRGRFDGYSTFLSAGAGAQPYTTLGFDSQGILYFDEIVPTNSVVGRRYSSQLSRDPSAHYHIVAVWDTGNATASDRMRLYLNGVRLTSFSLSSDPSLNAQTTLNSNSYAHYLGIYPSGANGFDGLLSEVNFIDGQALDASYFGEFNADGVWVPKAYSGTYGTNGFYLPFNDGSNLTTLGYDSSGNGNNWTLNGVSLTAGATYDWMDDTPTNNYAVLNPLDAFSASFRLGEFYNANLSWRTLFASNPQQVAVCSVQWPTSGSYYCEVTIDSISLDGTWGYLSVDGELGVSWYERQVSGSGEISGSAGTVSAIQFGAGTVVQIACDCDSGKLWYGLDGTWATVSGTPDPAAGTGHAHVLNATRMIGLRGRSGSSYNGASFNFGQRPFAYTPPSGFSAVCTSNMPAVAISNPKKHFDIKTQLGSAVNTGANLLAQFTDFVADLAWGKDRAAVNNHQLVDTVRGTTAVLQSNTTAAETAYVAPTSGDNCVAWGWKAGGAAVTNTAGSITSQVSANVAAGFSIVTYTGSGANATVGHGLGVAPKMVIVKNRTNVGTYHWFVYHAGVTPVAADCCLFLNTSDASAGDVGVWNSTAPASTVFTLGNGIYTNSSGIDHAAYCFAEVPGFSKFGSYTGNGSVDGPFVYCGFKPRYVMVKRSDSTGDWFVVDTSRNTANPLGSYLVVNSSAAEITSSLAIDATANGFKVRVDGTSWHAVNPTGGTVIFAAFAENPFGGSNVAPAPAR